jgi:hypothetical protein
LGFDAGDLIEAGMIDAGHHGVLVAEFHLAEGVAGEGRGVVVGDDQVEAFAVRVSQRPEAAVDIGRALPVGAVVAEGLARESITSRDGTRTSAWSSPKARSVRL